MNTSKVTKVVRVIGNAMKPIAEIGVSITLAAVSSMVIGDKLSKINNDYIDSCVDDVEGVVNNFQRKKSTDDEE